MKRFFIRNIPPLLLCAVFATLLSACSASPALDKGGYFFRVEEGTTFQAGGNWLEEDNCRQPLSVYQVTRVEGDSPIYGLLARYDYPDAFMPTGTCTLFLCSETPFYLEMSRSKTVYDYETFINEDGIREKIHADEPRVYDYNYFYSGINRFEVDGRVWYVSDYRYSVNGEAALVIIPDTLVSDTAREAPYYSDDREDTFLHYLREAQAGG